MADEAIDGAKASQPLNDPVFTIAESDDMLWQGDILFNCPFLVAPGVIDSGKVNTVDVDYYNVIAITQTCDIKDRDVKLLLAAPVMAIGDYIDLKIAERKEKMNAQKKPVFKNIDEEKGFVGSKVAELRSYKLFRYHYITGCTIPGHETDDLVVDFSSAFSHEFAYMERFVKEHGDGIRLNHPFLEKFSQAIGSYYSRVALPELGLAPRIGVVKKKS